MTLLAQAEGLSAATKELLNYGVLGAIVVIGGTAIIVVCRWLKPWIEAFFKAHFGFLETTSETNKQIAGVLTEIQGSHKGVRRAMGHHGDAIVELASEDKRPAVREHVRKAHDALEDED